MDAPGVTSADFRYFSFLSLRNFLPPRRFPYSLRALSLTPSRDTSSRRSPQWRTKGGQCGATRAPVGPPGFAGPFSQSSSLAPRKKGGERRLARCDR
ncbi:hypothetical protein MRX96_044838 [Rhipicephalus microplus]